MPGAGDTGEWCYCSPSAYFLVGETGQSQLGTEQGDAAFDREVSVSTAPIPRMGSQPRLREVQNALRGLIFKSMPCV